jgi:ComF family protein
MRAPEPLAAEFYCASCRTPFVNEFPLAPDGRCALCRNGLRGFDFAYCYGSYDGPLKDLVHLYKYGRVQALSGHFTKWLAAALPLDASYDVVVPVPLHWRRRWHRGFNQAALLGRGIAKARGIRFANLLSRKRWTGSQASLANSDRRANVSGAFRVRGELKGLRVLLIDDVMTTGATASACASTLKRAGAKSVTLLTLARVDRRLAAPSARTSTSGAS